MKSLFVGMQKSLSCTHGGCGTDASRRLLTKSPLPKYCAVRMQLAKPARLKGKPKAPCGLPPAIPGCSCRPIALRTPAWHERQQRILSAEDVRSPQVRDRFPSTQTFVCFLRRAKISIRRSTWQPKPTSGWQFLLELLFQLGDIDLRDHVRIQCIAMQCVCLLPFVRFLAPDQGLCP